MRRGVPWHDGSGPRHGFSIEQVQRDGLWVAMKEVGGVGWTIRQVIAGWSVCLAPG